MRGKQAKKREIKPDDRFNSHMVAKFINYVMVDGKKTVAQKNVYDAIDELAKKTKTKKNADILEALEKSIGNVKPRVEVRSKRVGGSNFQVPMPVTPERQLALAFRWIIDSARKARKSTPFSVVLGRELIDAFNNEGNAVRKKEETHKMADANKAFAQFA